MIPRKHGEGTSLPGIKSPQSPLYIQSGEWKILRSDNWGIFILPIVEKVQAFDNFVFSEHKFIVFADQYFPRIQAFSKCQVQLALIELAQIDLSAVSVQSVKTIYLEKCVKKILENFLTANF